MGLKAAMRIWELPCTSADFEAALNLITADEVYSYLSNFVWIKSQLFKQTSQNHTANSRVKVQSSKSL